MSDRKPDPFVVVPTYVVKEAPDTLDVYCAIRMYADYTTGECWPSIDTITKVAGCSRRTVERKLTKLTSIGAIEVVSGRSSGKSNLYRFPPQRFAGYVTGDAPGATPMSQGVRHQGTTNENHLPRPIEPSEATGLVDGRDLLWEMFVKVHGEPATRSERGKYNAIVKTLREAQVTPDEYPQLVAAFTAKHDGLQPAVATVAQRVGELRHYLSRGPVRTRDVDQERRWKELEDQYDMAALEQEVND